MSVGTARWSARRPPRQLWPPVAPYAVAAAVVEHTLPGWPPVSLHSSAVNALAVPRIALATSLFGSFNCVGDLLLRHAGQDRGL